MLNLLTTCWDAPLTCWDPPLTCWDAPHTCWDAPLTCLETPHTCLETPHTCFDAPLGPAWLLLHLLLVFLCDWHLVKVFSCYLCSRSWLACFLGARPLPTPSSLVCSLDLKCIAVSSLQLCSSKVCLLQPWCPVLAGVLPWGSSSSRLLFTGVLLRFEMYSCTQVKYVHCKPWGSWLACFLGAHPLSAASSLVCGLELSLFLSCVF